MSRGGDRGVQQRARPMLGTPREPPVRMLHPRETAPGRPERGEPRPAAAANRTIPEREEARRYREERQTDLLAQWRLTHPTIAEQQMVAALAAAGERYGVDYEREFKIAPSLHVDFAWPADRVIVVRWNLVKCQELPAALMF